MSLLTLPADAWTHLARFAPEAGAAAALSQGLWARLADKEAFWRQVLLTRLAACKDTPERLVARFPSFAQYFPVDTGLRHHRRTRTFYRPRANLLYTVSRGIFTAWCAEGDYVIESRRACMSRSGRYVAASRARTPNVPPHVDLHDVEQRRIVKSYRGFRIGRFCGDTLVLIAHCPLRLATVNMETLEPGALWEGTALWSAVMHDDATIILRSANDFQVRSVHGDVVCECRSPFERPTMLLDWCMPVLKVIDPGHDGSGVAFINLTTGALVDHPQWQLRRSIKMSGIPGLATACKDYQIQIFDADRVLRRVRALDPRAACWDGRTLYYWEARKLMRLEV